MTIYLPLIGQVAIALGKKPQDITEADLPAIKEKLEAIRANAALVGDVVTSQTALATGHGRGARRRRRIRGRRVCRARSPISDWVLPDVGGVRWQQAIGRLCLLPKKEAATKFVQYVLSPEARRGSPPPPAIGACPPTARRR